MKITFHHQIVSWYQFIGVFFLTVNGIAAAPYNEAGTEVQHRLQNAIQVTTELYSKAEEADPNDFRLKQPHPIYKEDDPLLANRFPLQSHVALYNQIRPWSWSYAGLRAWDQRPDVIQKWPTLAEAPNLRKLILDPDPKMRGIAADALAILLKPEDVTLIAELLDDRSPSLPILVFCRPGAAMIARFHQQSENPLTLWREWHKRTVGKYAAAALFFMTNEEFKSKKDFDKWWRDQQDAEECLWYWQRILEVGIDEINWKFRYLELPQQPRESYDDWRKRRQQVFENWGNQLFTEVSKKLALKSPDVEAKVKLLAHYRGMGGGGIPDPFFPGPLKLRISPERLLGILARHTTWRDVDWNMPEGKAAYDNMLNRLILEEKIPLRPEDAPRLRQILHWDRPDHLTENPPQLIVLLSRLLPPALPNDLDNLETQDGLLRTSYRKNHFARFSFAKELVRVGLPVDKDFLQTIFFAEKYEPGTTIKEVILQALGESPLTPEKRAFLCELLLDERFRESWTRPVRRMGDDGERIYAIRAVNAHAGKEILSQQQQQNLGTTERSEQTLTEVLRIIRGLQQLN